VSGISAYLLDQGLALGPQEIVATDGPNGIYAASAIEGIKIKVEATRPDAVEGTLGAGDAVVAGLLITGVTQSQISLLNRAVV